MGHLKDFAENKIAHLLVLDWQIQPSPVGFANPTGAIGRIIFFEIPKISNFPQTFEIDQLVSEMKVSV